MPIPIDLRAYQFSNGARFTLAARLTASATSIPLADTSILPSLIPPGEFPIENERIASLVINDGVNFEVVYCTAFAGGALTVERGREGTAPAEFAAGTQVVHTVTRGFLEQQAQVSVPVGAPVLSIDVYTDFTSPELTWTVPSYDADDDILAYDIYRALPTGGFSLVTSVPSNVLTYIDTDIDASEIQYRYYVIARAYVAGAGAASDTVSMAITTDLIILTEDIFRRATTLTAQSLQGSPYYDYIYYTEIANSANSPMFRLHPIEGGKYYAEFEVIDDRDGANLGWDFGFGLYTTGDYSNNLNPGISDAGLAPSTLMTYDGYQSATRGELNPGTGIKQTLPVGTQLLKGDIVRIAVDIDNQKVWVGLNGAWIGLDGDGAQSPDDVLGGYWPEVDTSQVFVPINAAPPRPATLRQNLFMLLGGGSPPAQSSVGVMVSEEFWVYAPPVGFSEWPGEPKRLGKQTTQIDLETNHPLATQVYDGLGICRLNTGSGGVARKVRVRNVDKDMVNGGKFYFEYTTWLERQGGTNQMFVGVELPNAVFSGAGYLDGAVHIDKRGRIFSDFAGDGVPTPYTIGFNYFLVDGRSTQSIYPYEYIMVAVDLDNMWVYFGFNGQWLSGIVPGEAPGIPIPAIGDETWNPFFVLDGATHRGVINLGGIRFLGPVPSGYSGWADEV